METYVAIEPRPFYYCNGSLASYGYLAFNCHPRKYYLLYLSDNHPANHDYVHITVAHSRHR